MGRKSICACLGFFALIILPSIAYAQPTAAFSGTPLSGCSPITVTFTDQSSGSPTSWLWDFGNGNTSTLQNPIAAYPTPGTYTISLTATNGGGSNTLTMACQIKPTPVMR